AGSRRGEAGAENQVGQAALVREFLAGSGVPQANAAVEGGAVRVPLPARRDENIFRAFSGWSEGQRVHGTGMAAKDANALVLGAENEDESLVEAHFAGEAFRGRHDESASAEPGQTAREPQSRGGQTFAVG